MTATLPPSDDLRPGELRAFRGLTTLAAVATPLFGLMHRAADAGVTDPFALRVGLTALCVALVVLTVTHPKRWLLRVLYVTFYAYGAWALWLLAVNRLHPDYAVGALVVIAAASVGFMDHRNLWRFLALALAAAVALVAVVPPAAGRSVHGGLYLAYVLLFAAFAFIMLRDRLLLGEKLAASRLRYALAAEGANAGLWDWDVAADQLYLSRRWNEMLGLEAQEHVTDIRGWLDRVHPDDRTGLEAELDRHRDAPAGHFQSEFRILHDDGTWRWFIARGTAVRDAEGRATRMAGSQTDVTAQKRAEAQLLHDAFHDSLTGLPNRALLADRLTQVLTHSMRHRQDTFALLYLDLDRFKVVNDSLGHAAGDDLLQGLAARLSRLLRQADTVARLGGDEFAIVLPNLDGPEVPRIVERIQTELGRPIGIGSRGIVTSASIGIVLGPGEYTRAEDMLRDADIAMYRAKAQGPGRYAIFDDAVQEHTLSRLEMESDLRSAVDRGQLRLHYQPIMSLRSGRLVGFEALVRWEHPERGLLAPEEFIPLAEETGLIVPLGEWILGEATRQARRWGGGLTVNVNVSGRQLSHPDFADHVAAALNASGLRPGRLQLEITESVLLQDPDAAIRVLTLLRELGVQLYLDDFGTGYSSFSYLHLFPIDAVKLDRSFVHRMDEDARNGAIVRALVAMAQSLGLLVVAEGVERPEEADHLRGVECSFGQGFLFSRPVEAEMAVKLAPGLDLPGPAPRGAEDEPAPRPE